MRRLLLALAAAVAAASAARAEPPVWVVRDADSEIVLFGSLHLLPAGVDWRPAALDAALKRADDLWFELPIDPAAAAEAQGLAMASSQLPPDKTLSALLPKADRRRLERVAARAGLPMSYLDRLQPWFAETVLGLAIYRRQGGLTEEGVERQIAASAPPTARLRAFESASDQIGMLSRGSIPEQIKSLQGSLKELDGDPGFLDRLVKQWLAGDAAGLDRDVVGEIRRDDPAQYRRLIVERNQAWTKAILERLAGSGHTVMVVGVGHLVGRDGLPAQLRARGVSVEGPK